jgi:hypothetical protein
VHIVRAMLRKLGIACVAVSGCAFAGDPSGTFDQAATGQAAVSLVSSNAALTQTSNTSWTLTKTGAVDTAGKTVTWTITATKGSTVPGQLVVSGFMAVTNTGSKGATIGNIVVNLQTKSGSSWVSRSADVADATSGDAATTAHIDPKASSENKATFNENSASGALQFEDANSNTLFSLQPEKTIAPGATQSLLFSATFDNNVLALPVGKAVRAEVIVSFGNAGSQSPSAPNTDINGNGIIDPDETWVRSIPTRLGLTVPAQAPDNSTVTISDTPSDIATTGTVTFSGSTFNIGSTTGTVSVHYDGGTSGGTITNCAHLTGSGTMVNVGGFPFPIVSPINLLACDTETIGSTTCTPGAAGCGWHDGDLTTYTQTFWSDDATASTNLGNNYNTVYASTLGVVEVGIPGAGGFSMRFSDPSFVLAYLPASGTAAALDADVLNPTTTSSGVFGGDVLALQFNIDFSDSGFLAGSAGVAFGNLTVCGLTATPGLNGLTVRQVRDQANLALGGGTASYDIPTLDPIVFNLDAAFNGGAASLFAQAHLVNGACP